MLKQKYPVGLSSMLNMVWDWRYQQKKKKKCDGNGEAEGFLCLIQWLDYLVTT